MAAGAAARASHQSVLSSQLSPPAKWSYLKIGSWAVLVFLCVGWLIFYINAVRTNSTTVLSASVTLFALVAAAIFVPFERLAGERPAQRVFRQGWATDILTGFANALLLFVLVLIVLARLDAVAAVCVPNIRSWDATAAE